MESHSVWQYLAPADRETFISGTICWLMDPKGDHDLGEKLLSLLLKKLELSANTNSELKVKPEVTEVRDKRFIFAYMKMTSQLRFLRSNAKRSKVLRKLKNMHKRQNLEELHLTSGIFPTLEKMIARIILS